MRYKEPNKREIPVAKTQIKFAICSTICILLLLGCLELWDKGIPTRAIAVVIFVLLCIFIVLYVNSVFGYGFVAMGRHVVRDDYGIWKFLSFVVVTLLIGILVMVIMFN
ncbi:MAG: hypothetical protein GY832_32620 [Chloroflexi bacterium]|nr:hypothetical protein [Chloroflexota bacterium]